MSSKMENITIPPSASVPCETAPSETDRLRAYLQCLQNVRGAVCGFYSAFPEEPPSESEHRGMRSVLFPKAAEFVSVMAGEVARRPDLFRHIPVDPEPLSLRQQIANVLRQLRIHFEYLHSLSADHFLQYQSGAINDARSVIERVVIEGLLLDDHSPEQLRRRLLLAYPARFLPQRGRPPTKPRGGKGQGRARDRKKSKLAQMLQASGRTGR